jgi:acyl dehydratase
MLSMAFLGQFITQQIADLPGAQLLHFQVRFSSMVRLDDVLTCHGIVRERRAEQERELITIECWTQNQKGEKTTGGEAIVSIART